MHFISGLKNSKMWNTPKFLFLQNKCWMDSWIHWTRLIQEQNFVFDSFSFLLLFHIISIAMSWDCLAWHKNPRPILIYIASLDTWCSQKSICDDETPAAYKVETSQLEITVKTINNYDTKFNYWKCIKNNHFSWDWQSGRVSICGLFSCSIEHKITHKP